MSFVLRRIRKIKTDEFAIANNPDIERKLLIGLMILVILLSVSYGYFIKQTVQNVVLRKETDEKISDLGSEVSFLEVQYIEFKNKINLDFAYSLGYKEIQDVKFVSRSIMSKTLTLSNN